MPAARAAATQLALATDRIAPSSEQDRHCGDNGFSAQRRRSWRHLLPLAMSTGLVLAAILTGLAALGSALGAPPLPPPLALLDQRLPGIFRLHMLAAGLALILLPGAILLRHKPRLHRPVGRAAAACLFVGAAAALPSAIASEAAWVAKLGFLAQGGLCLTLLILALVAIRRGERTRHAQLMQQAAATAFGAVVLRILLVLAVRLEPPFDVACAVIAWVSWAVPLAAVHVWHLPLVRGQSRRAASPGLAALRGAREAARAPQDDAIRDGAR
jgi:hypothetical protein